MKAGILILLSICIMAGCTTRASQHYPVTIVDEHNHKYKVVKRIIYPADSSWDKPAVKDTIYQVCPFENWDSKTDILVKLEDCIEEHQHKDGMTYTVRTHDSNGPVLAGAVSTLPFVGGMLGAAALIRPSKTSINQSNGQTINTSTLCTTDPCLIAPAPKK